MLENLWSFNEVLNLELILLFFLSIISQIPNIAKLNFATEKATNLLPKIWKIVILTIVIFSGFLTPTIDGYTQLSFAFSSISLYLLFLIFLKKRSNLKYQGISFFGI
jgi:Sec-independent protein secretion pathway component TatC